MIDFIQNESKKIILNCIKRYAEREKKEIEKVQLILGIAEQGNTYQICENYKPVKDLDFMGVLGVKIDFLGYSRLAPPFITKSLIRFSEKNNYPLENSKVMCVAIKNENGKLDAQLFVYNDKNYIETISFKDLFREEDFEIKTE
jgi:hypothetical protein